MKFFLFLVSALLAIAFFSCDQETQQGARSSQQKGTSQETDAQQFDGDTSDELRANYALKFSWLQSNDTNVSSYRIFFIGRSSEDREYDLIKTVEVDDLKDPSTPEVTINLATFLKKADEDKEYCFTVTALNDGGESPHSNSQCLRLQNFNE